MARTLTGIVQTRASGGGYVEATVVDDLTPGAVAPTMTIGVTLR